MKRMIIVDAIPGIVTAFSNMVIYRLLMNLFHQFPLELKHNQQQLALQKQYTP